jgi:hypothetical protein
LAAAAPADDSASPDADATGADVPSGVRPVSLSAESLRLSGEEMEILRHVTEGEVVEVDI